MSETEVLTLFKMAGFTPPAGSSLQEAYDLLQGQAAVQTEQVAGRDTSREEASAVKLTAVGTMLVCEHPIHTCCIPIHTPCVHT